MRKLLYIFIRTGLFVVISCIGLSLQAQDQINVSYNLQSDMQVRLDVLDQSGRVIETLKEDKTISRRGRYSASVKSKNLPVGTYFIRLLTSQGIETCRVIITK